VGHGKTGVEIDGGLAVLDGAGRIAGVFAAERHEVMSACVELIESEETAADGLGLIEPAVVREQDRSQEQRVGVLVGAWGNEPMRSSASEKRSCLTASSTSPRSHVRAAAAGAA